MPPGGFVMDWPWPWLPPDFKQRQHQALSTVAVILSGMPNNMMKESQYYRYYWGELHMNIRYSPLIPVGGSTDD